MPGQRREEVDLLFGILALQNDLVSREELIAATRVWAEDKSRSLAQIFLRQGMPQDVHDLIRSLTERHLERYGQEPTRSLAAASSRLGLQHELSGLDQADIMALVSTVSRTGVYESSRVDRLSSNRSAEERGALDTFAARFRVLRPHAKGGLGEVFVARDLELRRDVALKEIRRRYAYHSDSRARFVQEAEITGSLEHPGIVPVYAMGRYADGRPYYAMRFIRGATLRDAIESFHDEPAQSWSSGATLLKLRELLRRFIDVCNAVEYAHSRGVLHRDLKPGNVMLGKYGETLVVDWGLAKILGRDPCHDETAPTALTVRPDSGNASPTQVGQAVGTAAFMSPEQAAGNLDQVGRLSDVYSLGATLYCLLTGRPAFVDQDTATILGKVQVGDFPRPRGVNPRIPRALESICLRSMALHPQDRYESPDSLVQDLNRWLADESVTSHRETLGERATRLGRRHKSAMRAAAVGLLAVAAVATAAAFMINFQRNRAETLAAANLRMAASERVAKVDAQQAAERNQRVLNYLVSAFRKPDPSVDGREVTVASVLEQSLKELDTQLATDPLEQATLLDAIGETFRGLGLPTPAVDAYQRAYAIRHEYLGEDDPSTLTSANNLALGFQLAGRLDKAVELWKKTLELRRVKLGETNQDTLTSMNNMAMGYELTGQSEQAVLLFEATLELTRANLGDDHPDTWNSMLNLGASYLWSDQFDKAIPLLEQTVELQRAGQGEDHPVTLAAQSHLAQGYRATGQFDLALPLFEHTLARQRARLGAQHPDTLDTMDGLGICLALSNRVAEGVALLEEALKSKRATLGNEHRQTLLTVQNMAKAYQAAGQMEKSLPLLTEVCDAKRATFGADHDETLEAMNGLAVAYYNVGQFDQALPLYESAFELRRAKLGPDHVDTLISMNNLGAGYQSTGQMEKALPLIEESLKRLRTKLGPDHPDVLAMQGNVAVAFQKTGELARALVLQKETLELTRAKLGKEHPTTMMAMINLATCHQCAGQLDAALPLFEETLELRRAKLGAGHRHTRDAFDSLQNAYLESRQFAKAEKISREWLIVVEEGGADDRQGLAWARIALAEALLGQEKLDAALEQANAAIVLQSDDHARSVLGGVLAKQMNWADAEKLLLESYQAVKAKISSLGMYERWQVPRTCERIIELYRAQNKSDQVAHWQAELATVTAKIERLRGPHSPDVSTPQP